MPTQQSRIKYGPWKDLEPNVEPLVRAVNIRYETYHSCEGHRDGWGMPYPWVDLERNQDLGELVASLNEYNMKKSVTWTLYRPALIWHDQAAFRLMPECEVGLCEYHEYLMNEWKLKRMKQQLSNLEEPDFVEMIQKFYISLSEEQKYMKNMAEFERLKRLADDCPSLGILQQSAKELAGYLGNVWG